MRERLQRRLTDLENDIESLKADSYEEILNLHKEANKLEQELGRFDSDLEDVETETATIEDLLDQED